MYRRPHLPSNPIIVWEHGTRRIARYDEPDGWVLFRSFITDSPYVQHLEDVRPGRFMQCRMGRAFVRILMAATAPGVST